eukprot:2137323-Alexandrium_andersonii.AAC.1
MSLSAPRAGCRSAGVTCCPRTSCRLRTPRPRLPCLSLTRCRFRLPTATVDCRGLPGRAQRATRAARRWR